MVSSKCLYCNKPFTPQRKTAKYCSDSCRTRHWLARKTKVAVEEPPSQPPLRGVVQNIDEPVNKTEQTKPTPDTSWEDYKRECQFNNLIDWNKGCQKAIKALERPSVHPESLFNLIFNKGALLSLCNDPYKAFTQRISAYGRTVFEKKPIRLLTFIEIKGFQGIFYNELQRTNKLIVEQKILRISVSGKTNIRSAETALKEQRVQPKSMTPDASQKPVHPTKQVIPKSLPETNLRIMQSANLARMEYPSLHFTGRWAELLGLPAIFFHCVIHGKPGEGKSTFAIQLADYLAENFGNVLYISGEEGFSKTLKDKLVNANALSKDLFIADFRKYSEVVTEMKPNTYNFIVIDSLDTLGISAEQLRELRTINDKVGFITISQSTKDGKMRGSNEIAHDADIVVVVENGVATTKKNRFKETNLVFEVFPNARVGTGPNTLRNTI